MKTFATCLTLALSLCGILGGCNLSSSEADRKPQPAPIGTVSDTASAGIIAYRKALADEADVTAKNAANYKGWQEAMDDWQRRNIAARQRAFKPYGDALNQSCLGPQVKGEWNFNAPYDPKKLAAAAREAAESYRKAN